MPFSTIKAFVLMSPTSKNAVRPAAVPSLSDACASKKAFAMASKSTSTQTALKLTSSSKSLHLSTASVLAATINTFCS